ncbi:MAG TPA: leucine dehydrogenase, partial [Firmicutes bacterium]|jgi:leucine dehydrogenase|nr:leucine dehydrogenase [Bacillota bacterium]
MASGGYNKERALAKAANIYNILLQVFALAKERDILPYEAANALAEERIAQALAKKKE